MLRCARYTKRAGAVVSGGAWRRGNRREGDPAMCGNGSRPHRAGLSEAGRVHDDDPPDPDAPAQPRDSGWRASRRILLQAAATFGTIAAAGGVAQAGRLNLTARAQEGESDGPEALIGEWFEAEQRTFAAADDGDAVTVATDFPFYAVGVHWSGEVGTWPTIELSFSLDGATFTDPLYVN